MSASYGKSLQLDIFGASHGDKIGFSLSGIPAGYAVDEEELRVFLHRRTPGRFPWVTARRESDHPKFISGLEQGSTNGSVIEVSISNEDVRREDYHKIHHIPRPGHADYAAWMKYGLDFDMSGGGPFSGRLTAPFCVAGGMMKQWLAKEGITILSRIASIGEVFDIGELTFSTAEESFPTVNREQGEKMIARIQKAKDDGDSVGGIIECAVFGLPVGWGGPYFDGLEAAISSSVFFIPGVKGIEFGAGFGYAYMSGSESNDEFCLRDGKVVTETNHCGGILGGISNGMPLIFRVAMKPTPSIAVTQRSVNLDTMEETDIQVTGRHDPCLVPRAVPCVEAAAAIALFDTLLTEGRV